MALLSDTPRIFWAGDSTVKQNDFTSYPQCGIGQGFSLFVKKEILIVNRAENGRSTKSFIDEGRLEFIKENIRKGDFLFVQFGHNDEKNDPLRYTEPQTSFKDNLRTFIKTARDVGAYPLLITPLYRRLFESEGKLVDNTHLTYPQAMLEVGEECNVPVIDLCTMSRRRIEKTGDMESRKWFMHLAPGEFPNYPEGKTDNTHLQYAGAVAFAELIAAGIAKLDSPYRDMLVNPDDVKEDAALLID